VCNEAVRNFSVIAQHTRLLVILYAGVGILYFVTVLGWSPETSFYAVAQILTTVGQRLGISRVEDLQVTRWIDTILSKEVSKLNFRQYHGPMEKQRCEESEKRRE